MDNVPSYRKLSLPLPSAPTKINNPMHRGRERIFNRSDAANVANKTFEMSAVSPPNEKSALFLAIFDRG